METNDSTNENERDVICKSSNQSSVEEQAKKETGIARLSGFGIICALLSAALNSVGIIIVKNLSSDLNPVQIALSRVYVQFIILLPWVQYKHKEVDMAGPQGLRHFLWLRGMVGCTGLLLMNFAIRELSPGDAVTISYLRVIMVPFTARIVLKQSLSVLDIVFSVTALIGVMFVAKPSFIFPVESGQQPGSIIGILYAIISAALMSFTLVLITKIGRETYPLLHVLYYAFCGSVTATILMLVLGGFQHSCWKDIPMLSSLGILSILGQLLTTISLRSERAGTVTILKSTQIVIVYILQVTILGNIPSYLSLIGAAIVFSTSIGIGVRKIINGKNKKPK